MNESDLENSLRLLRPAEPSPELEGRIALALETRLAPLAAPVPTVAVLRRGPAPGRPGWWRLLPSAGWALAGAAAGVAAMWYFHARPVGEGAVALFQPAESGREVVSTEEQETVYGAGQESARLVRYTSIERHAWTNPATGARVQIEVPREDLVALPVAYQ